MLTQFRPAHFGRAVHDRRWSVILLWLVGAFILKLLAPDWSQIAKDGDLEHLPVNTAIVRGERLRKQAFPADEARSQLVFVFARAGDELTMEDRQFAYELGQQFEASSLSGVVDVWTERTPVVGTSLRNAHAVRVVVRLTNEFMATDNIRLLQEVEALLQRVQPQAPSGLEIGVSGSAAIGGDMLTAAAESVSNTHTTTIILVAITLTVIYRSPRLVLIPLFVIGVAASISVDLLTLLAAWSEAHPDFWPSIKVFTTTKIFVIVLLFGSGTDYCLFLTSRFREQCAIGLSKREALASALHHVGIALIASALTTIVGLAMMGFAEFGKFSYSGPAIAICLAVTLFACLSLVPALLATTLGNVIPRGNGQVGSSTWERHWERIADVVLARPKSILLVSLILALPLAWQGWKVNVTYNLLGELSADRLSRHGTEMLRRYFPPGEIGPLVVLAQHPDGELDSVDGRLRIAELAKPLDDLAGVAHVRSLYQPLGDPPGSVSLFSSEGLQALAAKGSPLSQAVFVSQQGPTKGKVTRLFLILAHQPFSPEAVATCTAVEDQLETLRSDPQSPWHGATFELTGPTVGIRDLERVTTADRFLIQILVTCAVLVVIVLLLRKPLICCYLIVTVVLSFLVTMGITELVFSQLRGEHFAGLDWKVPLFLFVILVAVGQDYNIYLVSRVLEEQRQFGLRQGLRNAVVQTGGIITSCGIIMAGTFVSMTTSELNGMVELGFALTLGILFDTFVVRTIIVPAFLALLAEKKTAAE